MSLPKPEFHLQRVHDDGTLGPIEIHPFHELPVDVQLSRRGFVGAGVSLASLMAQWTAHGSDNKPPEPNLVPPQGRQAAPPPVTNRLTTKPATHVLAHRGPVNALAITPDGKEVATAGDDGVKIWSLPDGQLLLSLGASGALDLAITPDGKTLIACSDKQYSLWTIRTGKLIRQMPLEHKAVQANISPDGRYLAVESAGRDGDVKILVVADGSIVGSVPRMIDKAVIHAVADDLKVRKHTQDLWRESTFAFTPDSQALIFGYAESAGSTAIVTWSIPEKRIVRILVSGIQETLRALATTSVGTLLVASNTLSLFSLTDGSLIAKVVTPPWPSIAHLAITPNGRGLASTSADSSKTEIKLTSIPGATTGGILSGHASAIRDLAISPDARILVSGDTQGVAILWDLAARQKLGYLFDPDASETDAITYHVKNPSTGITLTYTLPCGSPIPPGATCVCNCVPGTYRPPPPSSSGGTICTCIPVFLPSDRNSKADLAPVDSGAILERLVELPIQKWRYREDTDSGEHIGPMAQDFAAAFGVGHDDRVIHSVDAHGVAFAAIQGLHQRLLEGAEQELVLRAEINRLHQQNKDLERRLQSLEARLADPGQEASS